MRGCQRRIIMLKGTESQIFDEAYFLLRKDYSGEGEAEIISEAERIVNMNTTRQRANPIDKRAIIPFIAGFLIAASIFVILTVI